MKTFLSRLVLLAVLMANLVPAAFASVSTLAWPTPSGVEIGASLRAAFPAIEPSGLAWHSGRNQLMGVGDEGQVFAMNADGSNVTVWQVGGDLEDLAVVDPASSYVFLADEDGKIVKYDLAASRVVQSWSVTSWMPELPCGNSSCGMEALTYANGYFYAGYQYNGKIYVLDLSGATARKVGEFAGLSGSGYTDLSGLHYRGGYLYALYSSTMAVLSLDGSVRLAYSVPGTDQEGLALGLDSNGDGDANMFIAEDSTGKIYSYGNFPLYGFSGGSTAVPYSNAGVEIRGDKIDNNNNGRIDETNEHFVHPYYSTLDASLPYAGVIKSFGGVGAGDFVVVYSDNSVFRFSAFDVITQNKTTVSSVNGIAVFQVSYNGSTVKVNAYTGQIVP